MGARNENTGWAKKVPALEHDGKVKGESLDLLEYIDDNFKGPSLFPQADLKKEAAKSLLTYTDELNKAAFGTLRNKDATKEDCVEIIGPALDYLENAFGSFTEEGPYFLGEISGVDFAYAPFIERYNILLPEFFDYDLFEGRPKLHKWFEAMNTLTAYTNTKAKSKDLVDRYKKMLV
ncbi:hypothetical protein KP509_1Z284600 [Ceratopteris richardii]|nr:hypothetical protein KP509_1Z284600 [Ceratopteris richardii]